MREGLGLSTSTLLATLLKPGVRVGTSTPEADYAFVLFAKADKVKPGAVRCWRRRRCN